MLILSDPADVKALPFGLMRTLLTTRFAELSLEEPYDPAINGIFIVVEVGDAISEIERVSGCRLLGNRFSAARLGDADFLPDWECLELHPGLDGSPDLLEMVFVLSDDGYGVVILIPQHDDIDPGLLALCRAYGTADPCPLPIETENLGISAQG
jgi:hypothetical protein